jgi:hypothetical protein
MASQNLYKFNTATTFSRLLAVVHRRFTQAWCALHGHLTLLHFQPYKLSLQCAQCGYESEGWEVGRPPVVRALTDNRAQAHGVRLETRRMLRAVPSDARMAS